MLQFLLITTIYHFDPLLWRNCYGKRKIKLSLFYLMLCLIILLCLSNKVIAKENTPNSYNIPTDCYLKVTPRKKNCVNTIFYAADYCQEDDKSYNKKERMKKTAKKNFSKTTTKTRKRKKVSKMLQSLL